MVDQNLCCVCVNDVIAGCLIGRVVDVREIIIILTSLSELSLSWSCIDDFTDKVSVEILKIIYSDM